MEAYGQSVQEAATNIANVKSNLASIDGNVEAQRTQIQQKEEAEDASKERQGDTLMGLGGDILGLGGGGEGEGGIGSKVLGFFGDMLAPELAIPLQVAGAVGGAVSEIKGALDAFSGPTDNILPSIPEEDVASLSSLATSTAGVGTPHAQDASDRGHNAI